VQLAELLQDNNDIIFQIIGRAARTGIAEDGRGETTAQLPVLPFQTDEMFPYSLSACDLGIVILDEVTSKGSVPSKSYNLMSYGIPAVYVAGNDSELNDYAAKYQHAACFPESALDKARDFIIAMSRDKARWEAMSQNALQTSLLFRRDNADKFVELYLKP
jgi:hypothetical protein